MPTRRLLKNKKGQVPDSGNVVRKMMSYVLSWVTGARGIQAPTSIRYLLVGDTAVIARMRRDAQLEKNQRHRLEAELKNITDKIKSFRAQTDENQKNIIASELVARIQAFVQDYKSDIDYLVDIANNDASLITELGGYDKVLGRFLVKIKQEGFPPDVANKVTATFLRLSESFEEDAKAILTTAQSEFRGTTSIGQFSYKTSDTLDNIIRRVGRMINNLHNQILAELGKLKEAETKADVEETEQHANTLIELMRAELNLIKTVIEDDQVLIKRLTDIGEDFRKKVVQAAMFLPPVKRPLVQRALLELDQYQAQRLVRLRQIAQQLVFAEQRVRRAA